MTHHDARQRRPLPNESDERMRDTPSRCELVEDGARVDAHELLLLRVYFLGLQRGRRDGLVVRMPYLRRVVRGDIVERTVGLLMVFWRVVRVMEPEVPIELRCEEMDVCVFVLHDEMPEVLPVLAVELILETLIKIIR